MAPVRLVSLRHARWLLRILFAAHQAFLAQCCHVSLSMPFTTLDVARS
jgi:hypothetical protein